MKKRSNIIEIKRRMLKTFVLHTLLLLTGFTFSQDVITFTNGKTIEAKVSEILSSTIKYKKSNNPKGPLYTARKSEINVIQYENGTVEEFTSVRHTRIVDNEIIKNSEKQNSKLDDNGFFVDGIFGLTSYEHVENETFDLWNGTTYYTGTKQNLIKELVPIIGMRMGSKFYFGNSEKNYNYGLQMEWLSINAVLGDRAGINFELFNPGYTGILKLDKENAVEFNLSTGMGLLARNIRSDRWGLLPAFIIDPSLSLNINPGIKFRHKGFAIGIDYTYMTSIIGDIMTHNTFNLSMGRKF